MHHVVRIILSLALAAVVWAQDRLPNNRRSAIDQLAAENEATFQERDRRHREAAEWKERRFLNLARQFVKAWNDFVLDYDSGVYDARKAAKLAKAFHKLEGAAGWGRAEDDAPAPHLPAPSDAQ